MIGEVETLANCCEVEVGTHRPDACVSAVGKAEKSDVLRWDLCTVRGEVETCIFCESSGRTAQRRVSRLQVWLKKRRVTVGPLNRGCRGGNSRKLFR